MHLRTCGKTLLASFGFDERFAIRAISDHKPCKVVAVALDTGSDAWSRVERAFSQLRVFASSLRVESELVSVPYRGESLSRLVYNLARKIGGFIRVALEQGELLVLLSGGPRLLVLGLYILLSMLPEEYAKKITVRVEGEGFNALVEELLADLRVPELDVLDRRLVALIIERMDTGLGVSEAARLLGVAKSTVYRRLSALSEKGIAVRDEEKGRYYPSERAFLAASLHHVLG
ncbi:hypothetical protein PYJP_06150 [Pyrofollis japonicus]|uniref:helix-turn-helix domain-containing protein n=1 Tax=Pyrofollis japonicus TaxID=3060460 RepID=UPI00295BAD8A|nr:helix-turn-helix domain-containing protein [Pyrofollis japonicus]BEP17263.1 hypothetical protein PYJP_06150 [Pyrofollis japonicus]